MPPAPVRKGVLLQGPRRRSCRRRQKKTETATISLEQESETPPSLGATSPQCRRSPLPVQPHKKTTLVVRRTNEQRTEKSRDTMYHIENSNTSTTTDINTSNKREGKERHERIQTKPVALNQRYSFHIVMNRKRLSFLQWSQKLSGISGCATQ